MLPKHHINLPIAHPAVVMNGKAIKTVTDFIADLQNPQSQLHKLIENQQLNAAALRKTIEMGYYRQAILVACQKQQAETFLEAKIFAEKKTAEQQQELIAEKTKTEQVKLAEMARLDQQERNAAAHRAAEQARQQAVLEQLGDQISELMQEQTETLTKMVVENQARIGDLIEKTKDSKNLAQANLSIQHKDETGAVVTTSLAPGTDAANTLLKGMMDTITMANMMETSKTKRAAVAARDATREGHEPIAHSTRHDAVLTFLTHDTQLIREILGLSEEATVLPSQYKAANRAFDAYLKEYRNATRTHHDRMSLLLNDFDKVEQLCQNHAIIQSLQSKLNNYYAKMAPDHTAHQANLFHSEKNLHDTNLKPIHKPSLGNRGR